VGLAAIGVFVTVAEMLYFIAVLTSVANMPLWGASKVSDDGNKSHLFNGQFSDLVHDLDTTRCISRI